MFIENGAGACSSLAARLQGRRPRIGGGAVDQHRVQHEQQHDARLVQLMLRAELSSQRGASGAKRNSAQQETARVD
jgi:cAMP phosphodiesterase